jgi:hypothetical protein
MGLLENFVAKLVAISSDYFELQIGIEKPNACHATFSQIQTFASIALDDHFGNLPDWP